ncbi:hypothetical protein [Tenacibaculum agarivorans]|uniref:hypothetical protein n=1 Tax=Tenacibaculum agarivorans TaxID=1908389 RepID=UPI00094B8670|nr:hypothetical protein [Tenacibaculum agarivorans]
MNKKLLLLGFILFVSIIINLFYFYNATNKVSAEPYWHPFHLNSHLTLKSLVKNGYKFESMPCGQVQYAKQLGDTVIQYEVLIDCKKYKGKYIPSYVNGIEEDYEYDLDNTKEKNPYYPFNINEISGCYESIHWRVFYVNFGETLDVDKIKNFIYEKGGIIVTEELDGREGWSGVVYNREDDLYFVCNVNKDFFWNNEKKKTWVFSIIRSIPFLDQKQKQKKVEYRNKRDRYYDNE